MPNIENIKKTAQSSIVAFIKYKEKQKEWNDKKMKFWENLKSDLFTKTMIGKRVLSSTPHNYRNNIQFYDWNQDTPYKFLIPATNIFSDLAFPSVDILLYEEAIELLEMNGELDVIKEKHSEEFNLMFNEDDIFLHIIKVNDDFEILDKKPAFCVDAQFLIQL